MADIPWMLFVDGENFTIRGQELAKQEGLSLDADPRSYLKDVFLWFPTFDALNGIYANFSFSVAGLGMRAYYYTSVTGDDDKVVTVRRSLRALGFDPQVFKKTSGKSKGVDITLTKDMLSHAFRDHYQVAVLIAGDRDYVPLIEETKRCGKRVHVGFFDREGLGLAEEVKLVADLFVDLTEGFVRLWRARIDDLERARARPSA